MPKPKNKRTKKADMGRSKPADYSIALVVFATDDWLAGVVSERLRSLIQSAEGLTAIQIEHILSKPVKVCTPPTE